MFLIDPATEFPYFCLTKLSMKYQKAKWLRLIILFLLPAVSYSCIDPFNPQVKGFQSLLVVDALVTDANETYYCRLSRTIEETRDTPERVTGATVSIGDDLGNIHSFSEINPGVYKSDSLSFRGEPGRSYRLHITTSEGNKYESDLAAMLQVPDIDSLYFGKDRQLDDADGEFHEGIRIFIDSEKPTDGKYLRWTYEEWWKTHVPLPPLWKFFDENNIVRITEPDNVICWRNNKSDEIITASSDADLSISYEKKPLLFIASDKADRLMVKYYIKVRQYAITKGEFEFREQLKQIASAGGDIFDRQPFQIKSNIHNPDNPRELVLGYFQVSAVSEASRYITRREVDSLNLRQFDYGCDVLYAHPNQDFPGKPEKPVSFTQMHNIIIKEGYVFIDYLEGEDGLIFLVFARDYCSDCTVTGNPNKPDFWDDTK